MNSITNHACKMPRRRRKYRNAIFVCKCQTGWIAKYRPSRLDEMPGYYDWHPVTLDISPEAVYRHG